MAYQVALDPKLSISPAEFVTAWNQTPECLAVGRAYQSAEASAQFDPQLATAIVTVISSVRVDIAANTPH